MLLINTLQYTKRTDGQPTTCVGSQKKLIKLTYVITSHVIIIINCQEKDTACESCSHTYIHINNQLI